jgi:hypothetical protein
MSDNEDALAGLTAEDDQVLAALADLYRAERAGTAEPAEIRVGPFTAFNLLAMLQIAWSYLKLTPIQREICEQIGRSLQVLFGPPLAEVLERGWDVDQDAEL